ncbi:endophilin-B1-like isoform X2 [Sphaeramia orbicularis]|uniref:endophilin-B1-like isoform X2 n=1 Tax=Sphaeramia orbicularis TaxID=375764 RepID=UPI00117E5569|nr:endophilin-B1-like isoform X2 [Sphaeramia orbicularis]
MDLTRLAVDAGQFINRAVQYTEETLGQADRTELDPGLEELLNRADATKTWTDQIISQTEVLLQPNAGARLEDRLYEQLDWHVPPRPRTHEVLGEQLTHAGLELGSTTPYGSALIRCGEVQKQLGEAERKFVQSTNIHFLTPLRSFTEGQYRAIQDERKTLVNKRLDLDIAKSRLRKAHEADRESRDDYVAHVSYMFSFLRVKWLKMWAQEICQAEMELRICQSLFDRQSEITKQLLDGLSNTHTNHMRSLVDFVEAQACYFAQCNQHAQELQKQLASIPSVLCSNNWQSGITNALNQPSTSDGVVDEPIRLDQVRPAPVVLHRLPDFDQDSWTAHPPTGKDTALESSANTSPPDNTNTNNNNNTCSAESHCSSADSHSAAKETSSHICTSDSDSPPTDQLSASTRMTTETGSAEGHHEAALGGVGSSHTLELRGATVQPQRENTVDNEETGTSNDTAAEPLTSDDNSGRDAHQQ